MGGGVGVRPLVCSSGMKYLSISHTLTKSGEIQSEEAILPGALFFRKHLLNLKEKDEDGGGLTGTEAGKAGQMVFWRRKIVS